MTDHVKAASTTGTFQRAAIACQSCRQRKVKCDAQSVGAEQKCSPCRRAGQECLLDPLSDGRRSVSRKYVDKLQQRIETLEALSQRAVDRPSWPSNANDDDPISLADAPSVSGAPISIPPGVTSKTPPESSSAGTEPPLSRLSCTSHQFLSAPNLTVAHPPEKARDGSPTFFGATSHPHVVSPGDDTCVSSFDDADAVGIDLDPASPHLQDQLLQSFFKYQTLWVDVVNKESFLIHQANGIDSGWYSRFLENTMLACGARLSTSQSVRALGSKYHAWAKDEALGAMSDPTPASLQGFLLLSEYEVTQGNDRQGWMFCGVACRMLSDLGLHELASVIGLPTEQVSATKESDLAYALLSACVVYEGVWTLYLGRPSSIPRSVMSVVESRCRARRKSDSPCLNAWVGLCVPMAEISLVLNEHSAREVDRSASLRKLFKQVEEWYEGLPPELTYQENRLVNMNLAGYGLHTQYCKVQMLLRQALATPQNGRKRRYSEIASDRYPQTPPDDSNVMIYNYALRTARLVVTYREAFGMEKIPSIVLDNAVVAATTMIRHLNGAAEPPQQMMWLRQLIKSMESVQPHFPVVGRMLDSLKQICGSGPVRSMLSSVRRDSRGPLNYELSTPNQPLDLQSRFNPSHVDSMSNRCEPNMAWDSFDNVITPGVFSSSTFDHSVLDLASSDSLLSGFAQIVS